MMHLIPVIDLKDGLVVSAQRGDRANYQPINSILCESSSITNVIDGFFSLHPFTTFYIADLNAITGTGDNQQLINDVIFKYPEIEFWLDNGFDLEKTSSMTTDTYRPVIGSEYQSSNTSDTYQRHLKNKILSLDFFPDRGYTGPKVLLEEVNLWPQDIIIMTLDRVGNNLGPDTQKLESYCKNHPEKNFIAAGGVANMTDLLKLQKVGINQVLIASALHSGAIDSTAIKNL